MKANILTRLKLDHVASVDRGAGEGVKVMMWKRADDVEGAVAKAIAALGWDTVVSADIAKATVGMDGPQRAAVIKRISEVREYVTKAEFAMVTKDDLKNAIQAVDKMADPAAARNAITLKAAELGAADLLPLSWSPVATQKRSLLAKALNAVGLTKWAEAIDFDQAQAAVEAGEFAQGMLDEIQESVRALQNSVASIMCDETLGDKQAALETTFDQFKAYMQGVVPEWMEKSAAAGVSAALSAGGSGVLTTKGVDDMTTQPTLAEIQKTLDDTKAELTKALATITKQADDLIVAKMSPDEAAFYAKGFPTDDKKKEFKDADAKKRADIMGEVAKAAILTLPADVQKQLAEGSQALAILKAKDEKDAEDKAEATEKSHNLPTGTGKVIAKSMKDPAVVALLKHVETLNVQVKEGGLFKNFGSDRPGETGGAKAYDQLMTKAEELLAKTPAMKTIDRAFSKVYEAAENQPLVKLHKRETQLTAN